MMSARRTTSAAGAIAALALAGTTLASGAHAATTPTKTKAAAQDTQWNLGYDTTATTNIKKSNTSSTTTGFTFSSYNLTKGSLSSSLMLNDFKVPVKLGNLRVAWATIAQEPLGKATGSVDPKTHVITQVQTANLHIKDISLTGHGLINLAGNSCRTSTPVKMPVSGKMGGLFDPITLTGSYTIPNFANCGLITSLVNQQVAGSGNTLSLKLTPHG